MFDNLSGLDVSAEGPVDATKTPADDAAGAPTEEVAPSGTDEAVPAAKENVAKAAADASEATAPERPASETAAVKKTHVKDKTMRLFKNVFALLRKLHKVNKNDPKHKAEEAAASGEAVKTTAAGAAEEPSTAEAELVDAPADPEDTAPAADAASGGAK